MSFNREEDLGSESGSEDDVNDFIVDDDGQPITKAKKKRHAKYSDSALQEAQDIFGVDFGTLWFYVNILTRSRLLTSALVSSNICTGG